MSTPQSDKNFGGSIAKFYDEFIVPLIFEPYAEDLANERYRSQFLLNLCALRP
jgi:hypothetical protein